jgi:hypothetical protein
MFFDIANNLMCLKLIIGDSMGNIAKEVSLVSGEKFMKEGGKQLAQSIIA